MWRRQNGKVLTIREQMERHRANPVCATCHSRMDPYGFSLENFDVMGAGATRMKAARSMPVRISSSGQDFTGPAGLKKTWPPIPTSLSAPPSRA